MSVFPWRVIYVDWLLSTVNPTPPDEVMWVRPDCHPCQKRYQEIPDCDIDDDFCDLPNVVQRHTHCSTSYCLRKKSTDSEPICRFNFPVIVKKSSPKNLSADCRSTVGRQSADSLPTANQQVSYLISNTFVQIAQQCNAASYGRLCMYQ